MEGGVKKKFQNAGRQLSLVLTATQHKYKHKHHYIKTLRSFSI
jgi:hypothetical protein